MLFAKAVIKSDKFGEEIIEICSEEEEIDFDKTPMILLYSSPLAQIIMREAVVGSIPHNFFSIDKVKYTLIEYSSIDEEALYNENRINIRKLVTIPKETKIYIYRNKCSCGSCYNKYGFDNLESYRSIVKTGNKPGIDIELNLYHCRRCGKYFAEEMEIKELEKKYGRLPFYKIYGIDYYKEIGDETDNLFKKESFLKERGYSSQLSMEERREIILEMIKENDMNRYKILNHLSWLINFNGTTKTNARETWISDWEFLSKYIRDNNDQIAYFEE